MKKLSIEAEELLKQYPQFRKQLTDFEEYWKIQGDVSLIQSIPYSYFYDFAYQYERSYPTETDDSIYEDIGIKLIHANYVVIDNTKLYCELIREITFEKTTFSGYYPATHYEPSGYLNQDDEIVKAESNADVLIPNDVANEKLYEIDNYDDFDEI